MSNYKKLYSNLEKNNAYIDTLVFDKDYQAVLFDGTSLIKMKPPKATLKNASGKYKDFLYALGGKLVVSEKVKLFLEQLEERIYFEFIEVKFETKKTKPYYLLNIIELVDGFDWGKSQYILFDELGPKGNKVIRNLIKMEIDESKTNDRKLFSLLNFEGNTIIHNDLLHKMHEEEITGILTDPLWGHKF